MGYLDGFTVTAQADAARGQRVTVAVPEGEGGRKPSALPRPPRAQPLRGRHGEVHRLRAVRGRVPGPLHLRARRRQPARRPGLARASATASSTRSTTCAASTATCASRPARPRRSPRRSCSSSPSPTAHDAIYTKDELLVDDDGQPQHLPWEDWRDGRRRAHLGAGCGPPSPSGDAAYEGRVAWSGELGYGVRAARARPDRRRRPRPSADRVPRPTAASEHAARRRHRRALTRWTPSSSSSARSSCWPAPSASCCRATPCTRALSLVVTLFGVAVLFVAQDAHFLAAVQVIVYAGAIVVLFLFVIMLLGVDRAEDLELEPLVGPATAGRRRSASPARRSCWPSFVAGSDERRHRQPRRPAGAARRPAPNIDAARPGRSSPTTCSPSRSPSVLLVIAVVGAVVLARRPGEPRPTPTSRRPTPTSRPTRSTQ